MCENFFHFLKTLHFGLIVWLYIIQRSQSTVLYLSLSYHYVRNAMKM